MSEMMKGKGTMVHHNTRYVEYIDVFSNKGVIPSAGMPDNVLLFDTFNGTNPLDVLYYREPAKIYQKLSVYVMQGECVIEVNGKEETLSANTLMTIMPENVLSVKQASPDFSYFMVVFYPKLSNQIYNDIGITYSNARMSLQHFISPLTPQQIRDVLDIYNDIKHDILSPDYEYKYVFVRSLLNALTVKSINIHKYAPVPLEGNSNSRQYDVYNRFLSMLNKHCIEHRTVQHYAQQLGISSKYLSFVCISYSKKNASRWIDEAVIQKAKAMLLVHHYSFAETSEILHFPTVNSFSRFFKRVTGTTPKEFVRLQLA